MKKYLEPYLKEKSMMQLGLFYFGKKRPIPKKTTAKWTEGSEEYRLSCTCEHGVPGAFEQDVYAGCMRVWVKQGMPEDGIKVSVVCPGYDDVWATIFY